MTCFRFPFALFFTFFIFFNQNALATSFGTSDLVGIWYGHQVVTGNNPPDDPRWEYGTVDINNFGFYTSQWTSPNHVNEFSQGTIRINSLGVIRFDNKPLVHGIMSEDKERIVFIDGTPSNAGNGLVVLVRRKSGQTFDISDFAGIWYGHHVVSGDALVDYPRWGYGTVEINNYGTYLATWTSPGNANEVSAGTIQVDSSGLFTLKNQALTHGVINDAKDLVVFIDGTALIQGNALTIMMKRQPLKTFAVSDLEGVWCGYHVVSGDDPPDDPRWGYGKLVIDSQGQYTADWNSPSLSNEISHGKIQVTTFGEIIFNKDSLIHGAMNDDKSMFVFIDGSVSNKGNALNVFSRCSTTILQGMLLLLLK